MFDPNFNPYDRICELEQATSNLINQVEENRSNLVSTAWMVEQISKHMVDITEAINKLFENQKELEKILKERKL